MSPTITPDHWVSLDHFKSRFQNNLAALAKRYPEAARQIDAISAPGNCFILAAGDRVALGVEENGSIKPAPVVLTPASAMATANKMFPDGMYKPALVAGEDLGWLWTRVYKLPFSSPSVPGFRPPMFFLMHDLRRLRIIMHIQDWQDLLADSRVRLFIGSDCVRQFRQSLLDDLRCPWPTLWVTVTPEIWPPGLSIESIFAESRSILDAEQAELDERQKARSLINTPATLAARFAAGGPLNVLGITSRYTSFLQHSMRDWLEAFERLGHKTRLEIESADHELSNSLVVARTCDEHEPDLIVCIDHYRSSLVGIPQSVPVVMWVQDALPALFDRKAGAAQGPLDFTMNIDPLKMVHEFGYPADRMMSALIGVNDSRFTVSDTDPGDVARYACDVCFVSHASASAESLLKKYLDEANSPFAVRFWNCLFDSLKQIYASGKMVTNPIILRRLVDQAMLETKVTIQPEQMGLVEFIFGHQINNALFRHQSLQWLADAGVNLHLYGKGWEEHPTLARFARGPADNKTALASIYRSSKINLHISPHGAVHQRVMEGLASGGFFMLRFCAGDMTERHFKQIQDFCRSHAITADAQLQEQATPEIRIQIQHVADILQENPFAGPWPFVESLRSAEQNGYVRSAASIWGQDYDAVSFNSAAELTEKVTRFLQNESERRDRAESMRKTVLERFTYVQTSRQVLELVAEGLRRVSVRTSLPISPMPPIAGKPI